MPLLINEGYFALFLIVTLGLIVGQAKIKGFSLDLSAVIFVALLLGHYGIIVPKEFQYIGLILFIFTIGIQAGPGFFDAFKKHGRALLGICLILVTIAALITFVLIKTTGLETNLAIGIFNGALTSTPGLAAAIDATNSPLAPIGYGIAYPFGVVGVILTIHLLPRIFKVAIKKEEDKYIEDLQGEYPEIFNKKFIVENDNIDQKTLRELDISGMTNAVISRVKHGDRIFTPVGDTKLYKGDIVKAVGTKEALQKFELLIGKPHDIDLPLSQQYKINWLLVTNKEVVNKRLSELKLTDYYNATITRIRRSGIDLSPKPTSTLRFGDKLLVACSKENMPKLMKKLGNEEKRLSETNFLPIALGIVIGIMVGSIVIPFFGLFEFTLGISGGVLATAIILSKLGKTGPLLWSMSGSGNQLLRKLGLLMFLATVGSHAGTQLVDTVVEYGPKLFVYGAFITTLPMLLAAIVGKYIFKMNFLTLLGVLTGSMTSTPGLAAADTKSDTEAASVGYATVYPVALVLTIIYSQLLVAL